MDNFSLAQAEMQRQASGMAYGGLAGSSLGNANVPAPIPLSDRLQSISSRLHGVSQLAFETGMRLGILQPLPQTTGKPDVRPNHSMALLAEIEAALVNLEGDINRIRSFAG